MVIFAFVILIFMLIFVTVAKQRASISNQEINSGLQLVAADIASQLNIAAQGGSGYSASVSIPVSGSLLKYSLNITRNGQVIVSASVGKELASAVSYSLAGSILSDPAFLAANTNDVYSIPVSNGTISLRNSYGTICVDYTCPNVTNQAGSLSLSTQNVHAAVFNDQNSYVSVPSSTSLNPTTALTLAAWIYANSTTGQQFIVDKWVNQYNMILSGNQIRLELHGSSFADLYSTIGIQTGQWYYVVGTYNSSLPSDNMNLYINGAYAGTMTYSQTLSTDTSPFYIGKQGGNNYYFNGSIANVQVYNASLSTNTIQSLYRGGIGGTPIFSHNLVGWWPLNGNMNDYSGYGNSGSQAGYVPYRPVSEVFASVLTHNGSPSPNTLVGFAASTGAFDSGNSFYSSYTNSDGIATAILTAFPPQDGLAVNSSSLINVQATAFEGNAMTQNSLVAWYPMSLGQGSTVADISGSNDGGTASDASWDSPAFVTRLADIGSTTRYGNGYFLVNGSSEIYAPLGNYFGGNNQLSATAWVYLTPKTNGPVFGVASGLHLGCGYDWNMPFLSADGLTAYGWIWNVNGNDPLSYNVPTPGWHQLAITYSPSGSGTEVFYVDGSEIAQGTGQYSPSGTSDYWTTCIAGDKPEGAGIGLSGPMYDGLSGNITNVQAYSAVLTASQISSLYQQGIGSAPVSQQNLVAWWPLNGDLLDYSHNGHNAVGLGVYPDPMRGVNTTNSTMTPILIGTFDGNANVMIGNAIIMQPESFFTVSMWINASRSGQSATPKLLSEQSPGGQDGYDLYLSSNGDLSFEVKQFGQPWGSCSVSGGPDLEDSTNHLVTGIYSAAGISVYVDGSEQGSSTCMSGSFVDYGRGANGTIGGGFDGNISNVQVYSTHLSQQDIDRLYINGESGFPLLQSGLVGWYPLNGNANDYSTYRTDTTSNGVSYAMLNVTSQVLSRALPGGFGMNFNGKDSTVISSSAPAITSQITVCAWLYWTQSNNAGVGGQYESFMIGNGYPGQGNPTDALNIHISTNGGIGGEASYAGGTTFTANSWHFVCGEYTGTDYIGYIDSVEVFDKPGPQFYTTLNKIYIGGNSFGGFTGGSIANVQVYNRALNATEIFQLYHNEMPPSASSQLSMSWLP